MPRIPTVLEAEGAATQAQIKDDEPVWNPHLNTPLQEQFDEFTFIMPSHGKFNIRPFGFDKNRAPNEGEAVGKIQKDFDKKLKTAIDKMDRTSLEHLAIQTFNPKPVGEFQGVDKIRNIGTPELRNKLWKNIILTTEQRGL